MKTLEGLKSIDDGESFDALEKRMEEAANGDESLKIDLLTKAVIEGFIDMMFRKARKQKTSGKEKEITNGVQVANLNTTISRKIRIKVPPPDVSHVDSNKESAECSLGAVEEEEMEKKPEVKKQGKADSLEKKRKADTCLEKKAGKKKKPITKKNKLEDQFGLNPPPDLPQEFKDQIERLHGTNITFIIQKTLTGTDMDPNQARLSLPKGQVRTHDFLSEKEIHILDQKGGDGILCSLIQPCLEIIDFKLKKWPMTNTFSYTLIKSWKSVSLDTRNQLKIGSKIQLWSFRVDSNLWFALVKLKEEEDSDTFSTGVTSI